MPHFLASAVVAGELAVLFVGATMPSPLYPSYAADFGFGGVTLTLIYATYVVGNLGALLLAGRLSDQIGRRQAILPALGLAIASALVFLFAQSTAWLYPARILSGLATGLGSAAATAWLAELQPRDRRPAAALQATMANFLGIAAGPLVAGLLADLAPWPLRLPYIVYLAPLIIAIPALWAAPETVKRRASGWAELELRPRLGVPRQIRVDFLPPAVTAFVTFALIGFYAALVPSLLRDSVRIQSPAVSGGIICGLFVVAALVARFSRTLGARAAMLCGLAVLPPSVALLIGAQVTGSLSLLLVATLSAGIAAALGYRGSLQVVNEIAPAQQRGEVVSTYLIAVYLGNSVPIIGVGLLAAYTTPIFADLMFAIILAVLAGAAWVGERAGIAHVKAAE